MKYPNGLSWLEIIWLILIILVLAVLFIGAGISLIGGNYNLGLGFMLISFVSGMIVNVVMIALCLIFVWKT